MSLQAVLTKYKEIASSKREKGDFFERLMKAYLLKAPKYSTTIKEVWLWNDFPFKKEFGTGKDVGVDLVAKTHSGEYWAIQCKFYEDSTRISKEDVDTFLATSGRQFHDERGQAQQFANRLWIATSDNWSKEADEVRKGQTINFSQITLYDLENEPIDWEALANGAPQQEVVCNKRELRDHQKEALNLFHEHFKYADRGRLIMACGTGKTFTSLRIAENETANKTNGGLVLFLVPSIALLGQTLNEWTNYAQKAIKPICVCSDASASKKKKNDDDSDESVADLALPASTDVENIAKQLKERLQENSEGMTVVFSTYQSIERVHEAQRLLNKEKPGFCLFDLIICDEAHRTTGVALKAQTAKGYKYDESAFIKVHDNDFIQGSKRIYMTATPRLYRDDMKIKAKAQDAYLCSMDDEALYGQEVYRIGFGEAVKKGLLSDYKVLVLTIDDQKIPAPLQEAIADKSGEIKIDDAAKLVGCINALSKNFALEGDLVRNTDPGLMHTAVAFCQDIKTSKKITEVFNKYQADCSQALSETENVPLVEVQADHVDGSMGALKRQNKLRWLKNVDPTTSSCHILTNVRCLSEGVDVPSLDAVLFLSARNSQVDVVQSVGRVMRRAVGKKYGYIVIPVVVPHDVAPEDVLNSSKSFEVVWSVLNALRAHDDRFNAEINKIEFNKISASAMAKGSAFGIGGVADANDHILIDTMPSPKGVQTELNYGDMRNAIYARMVKKVGNRRYWEEWAQDVAHIAEEHIKRISKLVSEDEAHKEAFDQFLSGLRKNLNPSVSQDDAVEMLAQHIVTKPVFEALFENYSFAKNNPVSISMQKLIDLLHEDIPAAESDVMVKFYKQVAERVEGVNSAEGRQKIIIELYDKFFRAAFPKTVEKLGIVYTPVEVVDFIIHSVADVLEKEFGRHISEQNVHIIDPFVGTGTFIVRLLQSCLIKPEDLQRKYTKELHANELVLLAYYIASVNIENVYHDQCQNKETYHPFEGICLTDTFQLSESSKQEQLYAKELAQNSERVIAQQKAPIQIIIGNPPYSKCQKSANDNAQNQKYPHLDSRIASTYAFASSSTNKNALYDSYIKAFRWASDRLDPQNGGIIAFVSNGAWIDNNACSGLRKCLEDEFSTLYVFNLRGNCRTSGTLRKEEGGNVFGLGSRTPIALTLLVKKPSTEQQKAKIYYYEIGSFLTKEQKLAELKRLGSVLNEQLQLASITPSKDHDWINKKDDLFQTFIPLGDKKNEEVKTIFVPFYSLGCATARDVWCYNFSSNELAKNMESMIKYYNESVQQTKNTYFEYDSTRISWSHGLKEKASKNISIRYDPKCITYSIYRPFCKEFFFYYKPVIQRTYQISKIFSNPQLKNLVICTPSIGANSFSVLIANEIPDLHVLESGTQCFPLYYYEVNQTQAGLYETQKDSEYIRHEGISDFALETAQVLYGKKVSKEDIFYYIYGLLHSSEYRERFKADLTKMLPRVAFVEDVKAFKAIVKIGEKLADLHLNYETAEPYKNVIVTVEQPIYTVEQMRFARIKDKKGKTVDDKRTIIVNRYIKIEEIPLQAYEYIVNGKSPLEWALERYSYTVDKKSGITNDPNAWGNEHNNPQYILYLLLKLITVSVETVNLVAKLPKLDFIKD